MNASRTLNGTGPEKHFHVTEAAGVPCVLTLAAGVDKRHGLDSFDTSLDSLPSGAKLEIEVAGVVVWDIDLVRDGEFSRNFSTNPIKSGVNEAMVITLTPSAGVIGKLNLSTL